MAFDLISIAILLYNESNRIFRISKSRPIPIYINDIILPQLTIKVRTSVTFDIMSWNIMPHMNECSRIYV